MDSCERKNAQWSWLLQQKGTHVWGQVLQREYAAMPGGAGPLPRKIDLDNFWCSCHPPRWSGHLMPQILFIFKNRKNIIFVA